MKSTCRHKVEMICSLANLTFTRDMIAGILVLVSILLVPRYKSLVTKKWSHRLAASQPKADHPSGETSGYREYMFYVYVIRSISREYRYIGYTSDLRKRMEQHNSGKNKSTKHYAPFELIYYEAYDSDHKARKREITLKKNSAAKEELFNRLEI